MIDKGPQFLSNLELLTVLIGSGLPGLDVLEIARNVKRKIEKEFDSLTVENLKQVNGVGPSKACLILAAVELSRRFLVKEGTKLDSHKKVVALAEDLRRKKQEHFISFTVDGDTNLIRRRRVFKGTLNQSLIHPREIFADAVSDRAAGVILVHNHPSGSSQPSKEDFAVTRQLVDAGRIMGIDIIDHIVLGKKNHFSFQKEGILKKMQPR